jgi:hypothetical protein
MAVGQSEARFYMALRLLYLEPRAKRGRRRNKKEFTMHGKNEKEVLHEDTN